jgi:Mrp family chromosome partitioning ATPase
METGAGVVSAIARDRTSGLHVLGAAGAAPLHRPAAEIIASEAFSRLVASLRGSFDVIVVDTPPLLPVVDARIVADHADEIVMVATWRRTPKPLLKRALGLLGANRSKVAGLVVNRVAVGEVLGGYVPSDAPAAASPLRRAA